MKQRKIVLHGALAKEFGAEHIVLGDHIPIALNGITAQHPTFTQRIKEGSWSVKMDGLPISEQGVMLGLANTKQIDIHPEIAGSGQDAMIVVGVLLIATGVGSAIGAGALAAGSTAAAMGTAAVGTFGLMTASTAVLLGAALLYQGLTPIPDLGDYESMSTDGVQSFMFNGAINSEEAGGAVPIVYGHMRVGSTVISSDVAARTVTVPSTEEV